MVSYIILAALVLLLIVIFIPVIVMMKQSAKRRSAQPAAPVARPPAPAPPPRRQQTAPLAQPVPQPQQPVAPPLAAPVIAPVIAPVVAPPAPAAATPPPFPEAEPQGTQMVQWYGMLVCTNGPLQGKRFVIDEQGFYIGRDPAVSQVVIPDGRISKRHLRILARDGKVHAIDQQSTNGTYVPRMGTDRILDVQLQKGDTIVLADNAASFTYQI